MAPTKGGVVAPITGCCDRPGDHREAREFAEALASPWTTSLP